MQPAFSLYIPPLSEKVEVHKRNWESFAMVHNIPSGTHSLSEDDSTVGTSSSDSMERVTHLFARQNIHDVPTARMYELSTEERTSAFQDLHGALEQVEETPNLLQQRLVELDEALFALPKERTQALYQAVEMNVDYVKSLRLCFLRAERFNPERAAIRMAGHFETKLSLFQKPELLGRDILISDFDDERDKLGLELGLFQLLKSRDRVGRPIVFTNPGAAGDGKPYYAMSMFRLAFWFISLAARLGADAQRRGIIFLWWGIQPPVDPEMRGRGPVYFNIVFSNSLCSVAATHAVTDDLRMKCFFDEITQAVQAKYLVRFQTHYGSALECQSNLNTFGIPSKILPLLDDGRVHCYDHAAHLLRLRQAESSDNMLNRGQEDWEEPVSIDIFDEGKEFVHEIIEEEITPGPKDIILGRGKRGSRYTGNSRLRDVIQQRYSSYEQGNSQSRRVIALSIFSLLLKQGARFLQYSDKESLWLELDEDAAVVKILHGFRNHRIKINKVTQVNHNDDVLD